MRKRSCFFLWLCAFLLLFVSGMEAMAQLAPLPSAKVTLRSRLEGQFLVRGVPFAPSITPSREGGMRSFRPDTSSEWPESVRLDPSTTLVVCERIKKILLQELELTDQWRGIIELEIDFYPQGVKRPITLTHRLMNDGLHTRMTLADEVTPHRLVQAVVQVLLLEMANRETLEKQMTDIPLWMIEGMTQLVMQRSGPALIPTPGDPKNFSTVATSPVKAAKARLRTIEPPPFDFLASPGPESTSGLNWMIFQDASLVLTWELLSLPEGIIRYNRTLGTLRHYRNWQVAFLKAWQGQFETLTDVEKWWALVMVTSQRDTSLNSWSLKQSLEKLNEILSEASVTTIYQINKPKRPSTIHLQQIAENWVPTVQIYFFERIAAQLKAFELAAHPAVSDLAKRYRISVEEYIRQPKLYSFFGKDAPSRADLRLLKKRFTYLDDEREVLQNQVDRIPPEPSKYQKSDK